MKTEKKDLQLAPANPLSVDGDSVSNSVFQSCVGGEDRSLIPFKRFCKSFCEDSESISDFSISDSDFQEELLRAFDSLSSDRDEFELQKELKETFTVLKNYSETVASVYEKLRDQGKVISESKIQRVWNCGSYLGFALTENGYKLREANFCRDRLCPQCQRRKSLKMFSQLSNIVDCLVSKKKEFGALKFGMLTFTIPNVDFRDLSAGIDSLLSGFRRMTHDNKRLARLFREKIIAGVFRSIEITYNSKTNTWHPHMHCIFAFTQNYFVRGNYLKTSEWCDLWTEAVGSDQKCIVDARMIKNYQKDKTEKITIDDLKDAIKEASKYCVKGSDFIAPDDLDITEQKISILLDALSGRKLYFFTGCFLKARKLLQLDDIEDGDLIHTDSAEVNEEIATLIRRFKWSGYGYQEI